MQLFYIEIPRTHPVNVQHYALPLKKNNDTEKEQTEISSFKKRKVQSPTSRPTTENFLHKPSAENANLHNEQCNKGITMNQGNPTPGKIFSSSSQPKLPIHHQPRQLSISKSKNDNLRMSTPKIETTRPIAFKADISDKKTKNPAQSKGVYLYSNFVKAKKEKMNYDFPKEAQNPRPNTKAKFRLPLESEALSQCIIFSQIPSMKNIDQKLQNSVERRLTKSSQKKSKQIMLPTNNLPNKDYIIPSSVKNINSRGNIKEIGSGNFTGEQPRYNLIKQNKGFQFLPVMCFYSSKSGLGAYERNKTNKK